MTDAVALALGAVLAIGALAYVLYPLFFDTGPAAPVAPPAAPPEASAIRALREIEFDRATGKLSDSDYQELRASYSPRALEELREAGKPADAAPVAGPIDIEERVRAYRATRRECTQCGLRPEPDAVYCSTCGGYLGGSCPSCAAPVAESGAAFCSTCGVTLSASPRAQPA